MRFTFLLFVVFFGLNSVLAQNQNRQFVKIELTEQGAEIQVSDGKYVVALLSEHIIQSAFFPKGASEKMDSSHSVLLQAQVNPWELQEANTNAAKEANTKMYILRSGAVGVKIITKPFDISYFYKTTEVSEAQGFYFDQTPKIEFDLSLLIGFDQHAEKWWSKN